jgi:SNF2 family DNA or RNA helicase
LFGRGGQKEAYPFEEDPETLQVVCVNVDTFSTPQKWRDIAEWANSKRTMIIVDEATSLKNVSAQRTQRLLYEFNHVIRRKKTVLSSRVKTKARAILTGTPVTNGSGDLWALFEFLRPSYFGRNYYSFQARYGMFTNIVVDDRVVKVPLSEEWWHTIKGILSFEEANNLTGCSEDTFNTIHSQDAYEGPYKHADELREMIQPVAAFKMLRECRDMPEQIRITREMTMTPDLRKCYDEMCAELITEYADHVTTAKSKLTALIRLQQICSGFICDKEFTTEKDEEETDSRVAQLYGFTEEEDL